MDFKKLIKPLTEYYGLEATKEAIKKLKIWYEDQAYDDDDIVTDWNPDAFEDSEGIDMLVELLKYPQLLNDDEQKAILYSFCCYHLLPNQIPPTGKLMKQYIAPSEPLQKIKGQFYRKLLQILHIPQTKASLIVEEFENHLHEEAYDMEGVEDDLENMDESDIIANIIQKYPMLQDHETKIFDILVSIVTKKRITKISDDTPLSLRMSSTEQEKTRAAELSKKYLKGMFSTKDSMAVDEKGFVIAKSYDISNGFPWLSSLVDTFMRFRIESHQKHCADCKDPDSVDGNEPHPWMGDKFTKLTAKQWFEQIDPFTRQLIQTDPGKAKYLCDGMMAVFNRLSPMVNLNYKTDFTIWDSYDSYARYAISINEFIYTISSSATLHCTPIQFDFLIIPSCVSRPFYDDNCIDDDDLWGVRPDFMQTAPIATRTEKQPILTCFGTGTDDYSAVVPDDADMDNSDDDDDDDEDEKQGAVQEKGAPIWDFEQTCLIAAGYKRGVDYFGPVAINLYESSRMVKIFYEDLFGKIKGGDTTRYKRYIVIIDRRNPKDIKNKRMSGGKGRIHNKRWDDRAYLVHPKRWNEICKEYQSELNEIFMQNLKELLLPIPMKHGYDEDSHVDFGALQSGNGYKFVLSFQIHNSDKVKAYWYLNAGSQRFFMEDIEWLWRRYFGKEKNGQFQQLSENTKRGLQRAKTRHQLLDKQFTRYRQGYKLLN